MSFLYRNPVGRQAAFIGCSLSVYVAHKPKCQTPVVVHNMDMAKNTTGTTKYMHAKSVLAGYVNMAKIDARLGDNGGKELKTG